MTADTLDKIVLLLVRGAAAGDIEREHAKLGLDAAEAAEAVLEAQHRIALAADVDRRAELGKALTRLNGLYGKAEEIDPKTALAAQKEINRLLKLYDPAPAVPGTATDAAEAHQELRSIADHLLPLSLAKPDYPLSGHARIAADLLRRHGLPQMTT